jgi:aerobic carbon-monoxide dehydrogenase medium subunit
MYTPSFEYQRAGSVAEALSILSQNENAKLIAGGHSLLPALKLRLSDPALLVDISHIGGLKGITVSGNTLSIGALSTHAEIAASAAVREHCPALASACGNVGDPMVRSWGTLGGNLAHADPASDPPTVMVACGATIHVQGAAGTRAIGAEDFFVDLFTTALQPGELITRIDMPSMKGMKCGYMKMAHPASRYAVVGIGVMLHMAGGTVSAARVAVGGATPKAMRSPGAEQALVGSSLDAAALEAAAQALVTDIGDGAMGDIFASADYRRALAGAYLKRAIHALG